MGLKKYTNHCEGNNKYCTDLGVGTSANYLNTNQSAGSKVY